MKKFVRFLKANFIIWAFLGLSVLIELTGVCITSGKFFIANPLMFFSILSLFAGLLFTVKNQRARYWCAFVLLMAVFVIDLVFIVVYDMTGSTFDYSMLKLRNDAMATIESIPVNFLFVAVAGFGISAYMILAHYYIKIAPKPQKLLPVGVTAAVLAVVVGLHGVLVYLSNYKYNPSDLSYKLYSGKSASYSDSGIVGNFVEEMYKGAFFSKVDLGDENELISYVYASQNDPDVPYFGAAEDYNVITILGETFEWFSFMHEFADGEGNEIVPNAFPSGYDKYFDRMENGPKTKQERQAFLRALFPNLYRLYDTSVACMNHHAREKTDISENQSIIGNYPTGCYINYDYPKNTIPYSVPNMMQSLYGVQSKSFHNGEYDFYNRNIHHENALGFSQFMGSEDIAEAYPEYFTDYKAKWLEHNLDTEMMLACKEQMFPTDRRFNTYITSISMHGKYFYRRNLKPRYKELFDNGFASAFFSQKTVDALYERDEDGNDLWSDLPIYTDKPLGIDARKEYEETYGLSHKEEEKVQKLLDTDEIFFYYVAATLEFDDALGIMFDYLENTVSDVTGKPLMDNTLIVLFGDHNAYYQGLGDEVKNLYLGEKSGRNYTDLFRVPLLIHIGNTGINDRIYKFTTTTDIVPTILDLLGARYYNNLYYGNNVFDTARESILYSRAYNLFITDKLYFSSLNNIRYRSPDVDESYLAAVKDKALDLLDKTSHVNRIFYYDYLSNDRADEFYAKTKALNTAQTQDTAIDTIE